MSSSIWMLISSWVLVAIGGLIGYMSAAKVSDRKEFQKAACDFQEAFLDVLLQIEPRYICVDRNGKDVHQIISSSFPTQMKAMLRFRLHLSGTQKVHFDKAWAEYCHYDAEPGKPTYTPPFLEQYLGTDGKLAVERIQELLKFSESAHQPPFVSSDMG